VFESLRREMVVLFSRKALAEDWKGRGLMECSSIREVYGRSQGGGAIDFT